MPISIRNKETYDALKAEGKCVQCGKNAPVDGMTKCDYCLDRAARLDRLNRARAILRGFCPRHRKRPLAPGYRQCLECVINDRVRRRKTPPVQETRHVATNH